MEIAELFLLPIVGLALGSFLNLTIERLPRDESLIRPASHCDACYHRLSPMDLVPIASYLWLSGRCRYCDFRIPYRTPLVEGLTAAGCGFIGYQYGLTPIAAVLVLYLTTFIHLIFVELEHSLILNSAILTALIIVLATLPFSQIHTSRHSGMQTMDQALADLFEQRLISKEEVFQRCVNLAEVQRQLGLSL